MKFKQLVAIYFHGLAKVMGRLREGCLAVLSSALGASEATKNLFFIIVGEMTINLHCRVILLPH